jgi:hypothetical protein
METHRLRTLRAARMALFKRRFDLAVAVVGRDFAGGSLVDLAQIRNAIKALDEAIADEEASAKKARRA